MQAGFGALGNGLGLSIREPAQTGGAANVTSASSARVRSLQPYLRSSSSTSSSTSSSAGTNAAPSADIDEGGAEAGVVSLDAPPGIVGTRPDAPPGASASSHHSNDNRSGLVTATRDTRGSTASAGSGSASVSSGGGGGGGATIIDVVEGSFNPATGFIVEPAATRAHGPTAASAAPTANAASASSSSSSSSNAPDASPAAAASSSDVSASVVACLVRSSSPSMTSFLPQPPSQVRGGGGGGGAANASATGVSPRTGGS